MAIAKPTNYPALMTEGAKSAGITAAMSALFATPEVTAQPKKTLAQTIANALAQLDSALVVIDRANSRLIVTDAAAEKANLIGNGKPLAATYGLAATISMVAGSLSTDGTRASFQHKDDIVDLSGVPSPVENVSERVRFDLYPARAKVSLEQIIADCIALSDAAAAGGTVVMFEQATGKFWVTAAPVAGIAAAIGAPPADMTWSATYEETIPTGTVSNAATMLGN